MPAATVRRATRFTVMAMLQAARARRLGLEPNAAYSFGLNRAIFFAAAKRGFRSPPSGGGSGSGARGEPTRPPAQPGRELYRVGEDEAYRDTTRPELYFTIGDQTQTEAEFARQVRSRFPTDAEFNAAWQESERIVGAASDEDVQFGSRFYTNVYKPRRDDLVLEWGGAPFGSRPRGHRSPSPRARPLK